MLLNSLVVWLIYVVEKASVINLEVVWECLFIMDFFYDALATSDETTEQ